MSATRRVWWFSAMSVILVLWGVIFTLFGLDVLPVVNRAVLLRWESALYGAIMIGWGTTLFFVGRLALRRGDRELTTSLGIGIGVWLVIEAVFSARFGVWFNVGVDAVVLALFAAPLLATLRTERDG
jgi:hypothetical protein